MNKGEILIGINTDKFVGFYSYLLQHNEEIRQQAIDFAKEFILQIGQPYFIIEVGPGLTDSNKERIMGEMRILWEKGKLATIAVWISLGSCPFLSVETK